MATLTINYKNYQKGMGKSGVELAKAAEGIAKRTKVEIIVVPPTPSLGLIASIVKIPVFGQGASDKKLGASTGATIPEAVAAAGASGIVLNHSEARLSGEELRRVVSRSKEAGLKICICVESPEMLEEYADMKPDYFAVEPSELIGTGIAVSTAMPSLLQKAAEAAERSGFKGKLLCGAGISKSDDARLSLKLKMSGVLIGSAIMSAPDPAAKILEFASAMSD